MSDSRTDFFASVGNATPARDTRQARTNFFAGKSAGRFGSGRSYDVDESGNLVPSDEADYSPSALRAIGESAKNAALDVSAGVNRGVMSLAGLPGDTAQSLIDLGGAGYSAVRSAITGEDPNDLYQVPDRSTVPLTGDWFAQKLDSTPLGPLTQMVDPEDPTHRVLYDVATNVPSAMTGGRGAAMPTMVGGTAGALASAAGADPATQTAVSMLAGGMAEKYAPSESPLAPTKAEEPPTPEAAAQEKLNKAASSQSMGAAGAAVDLQKLSPDLRQAVTKAVQETGGAVNPDVLARKIQADSLDIPVPLSEGQALGDARIISNERNARGKLPGVAERFDAQNKALVENMRAFRDTAGESVFSTNPVEHGDTLISRYQAIDDARNADIGAKYEALRDAAGGAFPVDTQQLLTNVRAALKKDLATSKAPADVIGLLEEKAASGNMTLEDFEGARTTLARIQRSAADGQERHAAGVIRNQIEAMPLQPGAEQLKGLADAARSSARERFQALEADPAYKAAVNGTVPPDKFVQKFVIGGTRDNVAKLSQAMAPDETAAQTLKVATLDHLRQAAGIDSSFNGKFSQAGYNKALRLLDPKLGQLLDPNLSEKVRTLGDVARYTQFQPEGSFVNHSNTFVAAAAEHMGDVLEGAANVKAGGIPVGTWVRKNITDRAGRKTAEKMFDPGAGLTKLSDLTKLKGKP